MPAIKQTIYIPESIARRLGELPEDVRVSTRINDMLDRYGAALAVARREIFSLLTAEDRQNLKTACLSWATRGEPAEILLSGVVAEIEDAVLPGGDLQGVDVSALLTTLRTMTPMQRFALIEWLEQGDAGPL
jgi:hypothetical protein